MAVVAFGRMNRRRFFAFLPGLIAAPAVAQQVTQSPPRVDRLRLDCAESLMGLDFNEAEETMALRSVNQNLESYEELRKLNVPLDTEPAMTFQPYLPGKRPTGKSTPGAKLRVTKPAVPANLTPERIAFLPVTSLAALMLNAIYGSDGRDGTVVDAPFDWTPDRPIAAMKIGYIKEEFERAAPANATPEQIKTSEARRAMYATALDAFRQAGASLTEIKMPDFPAGSLLFVLSAEAAAAFDDLTRSKGIDTLTGQSPNDWPNTFRASRFIPAVEFLRAQRARRLLMEKMDALMSQYDAFLSPAPTSASLSITNLTGHPAIALKAGFVDKLPAAIMVTGRLYDEATICRVALAYEQATEWHTMNPVV